MRLVKAFPVQYKSVPQFEFKCGLAQVFYSYACGLFSGTYLL